MGFVVKEFSDKSVELAKAAKLLGFHVVEKYEIPLNKNHSIIHVRLRNSSQICELDKIFFPELDIDDKIDLNYIINFRDCNRLYKENNMYQS